MWIQSATRRFFSAMIAAFVLAGVAGACSSLGPHSCTESGEREVRRAVAWLQTSQPALEEIGPVPCDSGGGLVWAFRTSEPPGEFLKGLDPSVCGSSEGSRFATCRLPESQVSFVVAVDIQVPQENDWHVEVMLAEEHP